MKILTLIGAIILLFGGCQESSIPLPSLHSTPVGAAVKPQPNVILILIDDLSPEMLYHPSLNTPNIDALLAQGALRFDQCYAQPTCAPTRTKLLSGLHNARHPNLDSLTEHPTLAHVFKAAGYQTSAIGKRHKVYTKAYKPSNLGFDHYCINTGGDIKTLQYVIEEKDTSYTYSGQEGYLTDLLFQKAHSFTAANTVNPFFLFLTLRAVHHPFLPPPSYRDRLPQADRYKSSPAHYNKILEYVDQKIGTLSKELTNFGIRDNTIIIITADNPSPPSIELGTISGTKGQFNRAGTRVPMIISWPEKLTTPRASNRLIGMEDFMPTFAELTGQAAQHDGVSFLDELLNKERRTSKQIVLLGDHQPDRQFCLDATLRVSASGQVFKTQPESYSEIKTAYKNLSEEEQKRTDAMIRHISKWRPE